MLLEPMERNEIIFKTRYKETKLLRILREFAESDNECVRVRFAENEYKSSCVAYASIRTATKRWNMPQIKVMRRGDDVYLVKHIAKNGKMEDSE